MKKYQIFSILIMLTLISMPVAQAGWGSIDGKGPVKSETRDVAAFTQLIVQGSMDVNVVQESTQSVVVKAEENLLELITTEVEDGVLTISSEKSYSTDKGVVIDITIEDLSALSIKGSGDIVIAKGFETDTLKLKVMGSGDFKVVDAHVSNMVCDVMGSGDIVVSGTADKVRLSVKGSGDISAMKLKADTVSASVKGSGDIATYAAKALEAKVKGSGDIVYTGDAEVTQSILGSGDILKK